MRVFLADEDRDERLALQFLIDHEPGLEVVGIATRSESLVGQAKAARPDVVLLDWKLVIQPASEFLTRLRSFAPEPKIIVLHVRPEVRHAVESAGADMFISKDTPPDELLTVLHKIRQGELENLH